MLSFALFVLRAMNRAAAVLDARRTTAGCTCTCSLMWVRRVSQGNGCDCGVFAVQFASYRARDLPLTFTQRDMHHFRQRICWEIANNACIG
eukprot:m.1334962 g.1334962  ORF g.1334962 m.1334962 type:complete len:91 (-) comp24877_c0_seq12:2180-2452(-)